MGFLTGDWLRYVSRSYQQIKDDVLTNMQSRVPEITDHTESNIFVKMVSIWAAIAEMLGYYTDNAAREAFLDSARLYKSGISHARKLDYRVKSELQASVDLKFTLSEALAEDFLIPAGTVVRAATPEIDFYTNEALTIEAGETEGTVAAIQSTAVLNAALGSSNGLENQEIVVGTGIVDKSVVIRVGGVTWTSKDTLAFSLPTDKHFVQTVNALKQTVVIFGNGMNGLVPASAAAIVADYRETAGFGGNLEASSIDTVVTELVLDEGVTLTVTNEERASAGSDVESLDQLKSRIPKSLRTMNRAVTAQDYIDTAELAPGVVKAGVAFDCGKTIDVYIVPDGGGLASSMLIDDTKDFIDERKMITTEIRVFAAGELRTKFVIQVKAKPQYANGAVEAAVVDALAEFVSYLHQEIGGTVELSDIYQVIEAVDGVASSRIIAMTTVPFARPTEENTPQLSWTRTIKATSETTAEWVITMVSETEYQIVKNNGYLGSFTVGQVVEFPELTMQLSADEDYISGQSWEFVTYPYYGTIVLNEPSLPVALEADIDVTVTGGL